MPANHTENLNAERRVGSSCEEAILFFLKGSFCVAPASLKLMVILPQSPSCRDHR